MASTNLLVNNANVPSKDGTVGHKKTNELKAAAAVYAEDKEIQVIFQDHPPTVNGDSPSVPLKEPSYFESDSGATAVNCQDCQNPINIYFNATISVTGVIRTLPV